MPCDFDGYMSRILRECEAFPNLEKGELSNDVTTLTEGLGNTLIWRTITGQVILVILRIIHPLKLYTRLL